MSTDTTITDIYLDNHSTTRVDPRVVSEMIPWFDSRFANPGSVSHQPGRDSKESIEQCLENISGFLGQNRDELIITSGRRRALIWRFWGSLCIRGKGEER